MPGNEANARSIILTGAAGVLGSAIAMALLRAGHHVLLTDRAVEPLRDIATQSGAAKDAFVCHAEDLTDSAASEALERVAIDAFGRVDMLINNAAFTAFAAWPDDDQPDAWDIDMDMVHRFFDINFLAQHALSSRLLPGMIERKWGRIVNITCSYFTMQRLFPYGATKAALEAFTAAMNSQLRGTGVTANTLNPGGPVHFPAHVALNPNLTWVAPEVANAPILWLASEDSNGVPGRRYIGSKWDAELDPMAAFAKASGPMSWQGFGAAAAG